MRDFATGGAVAAAATRARLPAPYTCPHERQRTSQGRRRQARLPAPVPTAGPARPPLGGGPPAHLATARFPLASPGRRAARAAAAGRSVTGGGRLRRLAQHLQLPLRSAVHPQ